MKRAYYSASIPQFLADEGALIVGKLAQSSAFAVEQAQIEAWQEQIRLLKRILPGRDGAVYFEFGIPRMGGRIDVLLIIDHVIFVVEFKVHSRDFTISAREQVWDYALDLKNFHKTSHNQYICPILVATSASHEFTVATFSVDEDRLLRPVDCSVSNLVPAIDAVLMFCADSPINISDWELGGYHPTPTIIEAAVALYSNNSVEAISRSDAGAINLSKTSTEVCKIIENARSTRQKQIVFVTGVPGAGKTLVGLNIAAKYMDAERDTHSVFLSGNGPLVAILREALARNRVHRAKERGETLRKGQARNEIKAIIQNVHHFRDEGLIDSSAPSDHVAIFDEAQRAWDREQTSAFMRRKKGKPDFNQSEPEFLISCMDRHQDWAVIICLVGGGQEINTGEAGISEWLRAVEGSFPSWGVHISPQLSDAEYAATEAIDSVTKLSPVFKNEDLHLRVSMRSFRAEDVSLLVKQILDVNTQGAKTTYARIKGRYPLVITRDIHKARAWLKHRARGSERYGIVVSSNAQRLKPHAIDIKTPVDPVHWFLAERDDVRSSFYLEDVATEFHVQGLELDWACVAWDADFRFTERGWDSWAFKGSRWERIRKPERLQYHKNTYRVLLTRARQGMVIVVPEGSADDATRSPQFYDQTLEYLESIGFERI